MKNSTNFGGGRWVVDRNSFDHSLKCYMTTRYTLLWSCGRNFLKTKILGECHKHRAIPTYETSTKPKSEDSNHFAKGIRFAIFKCV